MKIESEVPEERAVGVDEGGVRYRKDDNGLGVVQGSRPVMAG